MGNLGRMRQYEGANLIHEHLQEVQAKGQGARTQCSCQEPTKDGSVDKDSFDEQRSPKMSAEASGRCCPHTPRQALLPQGVAAAAAAGDVAFGFPQQTALSPGALWAPPGAQLAQASS